MLKKRYKNILPISLSILCLGLANCLTPAISADSTTYNSSQISVASSSNPDIDTTALTTDKFGNVWALEEYQVNRQLQVQEIPNGSTTPNAPITIGSLEQGGPEYITSDQSGNIWIANSNNGSGYLAEIPVGSTTVTQFNTGGDPMGITVDPSGNVFSANEGAEGQLFEVPAGTTTAITIQLQSGGSNLNDQQLFIYSDNAGNIYSTGGIGSALFELTAAQVATQSTTETPTLTTLVGGWQAMDPSGNAWIPGNNATSISETPSGSTTPTSINVPTGFSPVNLTSDSSGNIWYLAVPDTNSNVLSTTTNLYEIPAGSSTSSASLATFNFGNVSFAFTQGTNFGGSGAANLVVDPNGNLFAITNSTSDSYANQQLVEISPSSVTLSDSLPSSALTVPTSSTVILDGSRGTTTVQSGGVLKGDGSTGDLTVDSGGTLSPGHSPGCITVNGNLNLSGTYQAELQSPGNTACTDYDQTVVTGTVNLGGSTLNLQLLNGFTPSVGQTFEIINNQGSSPVIGTFNGLAEGAVFAVGNSKFQITYKGGSGNNSVVVTAVNSSTPVTAKAPGTPDTGFGLVAAHPLTSLAISTMTALSLVAIARKLKSVKN